MDVLFVYLIDGLYFILQWFVQFIKSVLYFWQNLYLKR